ncbi:MAG: HAD-IA family hydrolase [Acidobacteria bacterium]|nr:HAD-IA family hydrolase [Acidobacteriota bacterium]
MLLIVFDLDGTLIDSRRDLAESANQLIEELGGAALGEEAIGRMVGEGAALLVQRALAAAGVDHTPAALQRFLDIYDGRLLTHTRAYAGIHEAVRAARRHARVGVLTNKPARASERILDGLGLRELFDEVVGGDGPLPRKPDPASLLALMERAGAAPVQSLMVGDSVIDHETARRASVRCCLAAYGFGYDTFPRERLTGTDWVAHDPAELLATIERFAGGGSPSL